MTKKNTTTPAPAATDNSEAVAEAEGDRLGNLIVDKKEMTKLGHLVSTVQSPAIRDAFANAINARCSTDAVNDLIYVIATEVPKEKLRNIIQMFALSNASQLRQALEKGYAMPPSGKASANGSATAGC
jgi:hypothetical protein